MYCTIDFGSFYIIPIYRKHEFGLNNKELQNFLQLCHSLRNLLPNLNESFQKICPISVVSQKLGMTALEMDKLNLTKSFDLDLKTLIADINNLIRDVSSKLKSNI